VTGEGGGIGRERLERLNGKLAGLGFKEEKEEGPREIEEGSEDC